MQDTNITRTVEQLRQRYNLDNIAVAVNDVGEVQQGLVQTNNELESFITATESDISGLQTQIDGNITTWFNAGIPTLTNTPAMDWTTDTQKNKHLGDLYYDTETDFAYRFMLVETVYSWQQLSDEGIAAALEAASHAQDTADGKRRVFVATPTTPYDVGDLWLTSLTDLTGDLKKCITAAASGAYNAAHWVIATKYTDDTVANQALEDAGTAISNAATAQGTADGKVTTFFDASIPTAEAIGDLWIHTDDENKLYRAASIGANEIKAGEWVLVQDAGIANAISAASDAQSTADGKIVTFYANSAPTATSIGDLWFDLDDKNKLYRASAVGNANWVEVRDTDISQALQDAATAQGAAEDAQTTADEKIQTYYQSAMPLTEYTNIPNNATYNKLVGDMWHDTDTAQTWRYSKVTNGANFDYKFLEMNIPNSVFDTIDGKRTVFTATPTVPYYVGDLWLTSLSATTGDLKKCITERLTGSYTAAEWVVATKYTDDTTANTAISNAEAAQSTANTGVTNAATANGLLADIASDSKLTPDEKQTIKREYDIIVSEKALNDTQADLFGVSKVDYGAKYTTWKDYIDPLITNLTTTSDITGATLRTNFKDYYDARTNLLNAIATKAKDLADTASEDLGTFVSTTFADFVIAVENDGNLTAWFYDGEPTLANEPASLWTTPALLAEHVNDMYYDRQTGYYYQFIVYEGVYSWKKNTNVDTVLALSTANEAKDTADQKRRVFKEELPDIPTPPYDAGDLWLQGQEGDIMRCFISRLIDDENYTIDDWIKASKYTDDTVANQAAFDILAINNDLDVNVESSKLGQIYKTIDDFTFAFIEKGYSNLVPNSVLIHGSSENEYFAKTGTWETVQSQEISTNTKANFMCNCTAAGKLEWLIRTVPNTAYTLGIQYNNAVGENSSVKINNNGVIIEVVDTAEAAEYIKTATGFIAAGNNITITIETDGTNFGYSDLMLNYGVLDLGELTPNALTWQPANGEVMGANIVMSQEGIEIYMLKDATGTYTLRHIMDASGSRVVDGKDNIITSFDVEGILTNRITLVDETGTGSTQIDIGNFTIIDLAGVTTGSTTEYNNLEY